MKIKPQASELVWRIIPDWAINQPFSPAIQAAFKAGLRGPHASPESGWPCVTNSISKTCAFASRVKESSKSFVPPPSGENASLAAAERKGFLPADPPATFPSIHRSCIRILVVYEAELNHDRARFMEEELTRRLGQSFIFLVSFWKLKSLRHPKMLKEATDCLVSADVVCFSLLSGGELPQAVAKWMEKVLLGGQRRRLSLLALLESGGLIAPRLSPAEIYLSHLSSVAGLDCLCYSDSIPVARTIRRKRWKSQVKRRLRLARRVLYAAARSHQNLPGHHLFSTPGRLARASRRENLQP